MGRTITIIIAIIAAIVLYFLVHHSVVRRNTKRAQTQALEITSDAVRVAMKHLIDEHFIDEPVEFLSAGVVPDGWGRGVMAFEFLFLIDSVTNDQLVILRQRLNSVLAEYCANHSVETVASGAQSTFLVTDAWRHTKRVHLNVAYLVNEATVEYIQDLHLIDRNQPV